MFIWIKDQGPAFVAIAVVLFICTTFFMFTLGEVVSGPAAHRAVPPSAVHHYSFWMTTAKEAPVSRTASRAAPEPFSFEEDEQ